MSSFAFTSAYLPGSQDDTATKRKVRERLKGNPESAHGPQIRMVLFEADTMTAADARRRVERRDEDAPRALSQVESKAGRSALDGKVTSLDLKGASDPANEIVDAAHQMYEDNIPKHFGVKKCITKEMELPGKKVIKQWTPNAQGVVQELAMRVIPDAQPMTELPLMRCIQRRALGFEKGRITSYLSQMKLVNRLMSELQRQSPDENYNRA